MIILTYIKSIIEIFIYIATFILICNLSSFLKNRIPKSDEERNSAFKIDIDDDIEDDD